MAKQNDLTLDSIEKAFYDYVNSHPEQDEFTTTGMLKVIEKNLKLKPDQAGLKRLERDIELILEGDQDFFIQRKKHETTARKRASVMNGTLFKIEPSAQEIKDGVLISGFRFEPFSSPALFADSYRLTDETGETAPVIDYFTVFARISKIFHLLGQAATVDALVAESDSNYHALRNVGDIARAKVTVTSFSIRAFYERHDFREGDSIIVKVEDWAEGRFSMSFLDRDKTFSEVDRSRFITAFENGVAQSFRQFGEYIEIPDQAAYAYFYSAGTETDLRGLPAVSLDEYPSMMREIFINKDDPDWILQPVADSDGDAPSDFENDAHDPCGCGHDHGKDASGCVEHEHHRLSDQDFVITHAKLNSVDSILEEIDAPIGHIELYAVMMDEIANGDSSFDDLMSRLREMIGGEFVDDVQETTFINFIEDAWENALEHFNPVHEELKMPLRSRLIDLVEQRIEVAAALLEKYKTEKPPAKTTDAMKSFHARLAETIAIVNADAPLPEGEQYDQFELRIGDLEDEWDDFRTDLKL